VLDEEALAVALVLGARPGPLLGVHDLAGGVDGLAQRTRSAANATPRLWRVLDEGFARFTNELGMGQEARRSTEATE
jgi:hypothetical protein